MSQKVKHAIFQTDLFVKGVGTLGRTLPSGTKTLVLSMFTQPEGLRLEFTQGGSVIKALVPYANVVIMELDKESAPPISA